MIKHWQKELNEAARPEKIEILSSFFKTGPGEYGEGDVFIGLAVPDNRTVSKRYLIADFPDLAVMLDSPIHEYRLSALLVMVEQYKRARRNPAFRESLVKFYIDNAVKANNWDLVDLSAPYILGEHVYESSDDEVLYRFSESDNLWEQRIAIVSTLALIRHGRFDVTIKLAERYMSHTHQLIHKAAGWMLREMGKRGGDVELHDFLDTHASVMPRTMLRYAIERLDPDERKHYMNLK